MAAFTDLFGSAYSKRHLAITAGRRMTPVAAKKRVHAWTALEALEPRMMLSAVPTAFDFGTATSPVAAGYTQVTPSTTFSATTGYGWLSGIIYGVDRGTSDPLTRDLDYTKNGSFGVVLPNGNYNVTLTIGDPGTYMHDDMGIFLQNAQVDTLNTAAGQVLTKTYPVSIANGLLNLKLQDLGGTDPNVVIDALKITSLASSSGPRVTAASVTGVVAAPVSSVTLTFDEPIQNGTFTLAGVDSITGPSGAITPTAVNEIDSTDYQIVFPSQSTPGAYSVVVGPNILDAAGNPMNQNSNAINGEASGDQYTANFSITAGFTASFDFGTATSPVAPGYTGVNNTKTFSTATGFGWQSGTIMSVDRGTSDPLTRDLDYTKNGTFGVNLPNGTYNVTLTVGDTGAYQHDDMGIFLEGNQVDNVSTAAGQIVTKTYSVTVTDGQLNLKLQDLGGSDPNACIEAMQIVSTSSTPIPVSGTTTTTGSGSSTTPGSGTTTTTTTTTTGTGATSPTSPTTPPPPVTPVTLNVINNGPPQGTLPFGAGPNDTSEYMLGSVEVNVVLFQSNGTIDPSSETWTPTMISNVESQITQDLTWWRNMFYKTQNPGPGEYLNFYTDFTYANNPVSTPYEPINHPSSDQGLWIDSFLAQVGDNNTGSYIQGVRQFDNQQRIKAGTDWSYTIFVVNSANDADGAFADGATAYSYVNGPFTMETYNNGAWGINRMALVMVHETAIIFGALDEYAGTLSYTATSGYYNTQNLNAYDGNPNPANRVVSLMSDGGSLTTAYNTYTSSPTSLQMIGWRDSNNNGIMDVLDVPLSLTGTATFNPAAMTFTLTGSSSVGTLANHNPYTADHAITLDTVDQLQYSLDGGAWVTAANYGTPTVTISQVIGVSTAGSHTISFRTVDTSLGLTSNVLSASFNTALSGSVTMSTTAATPVTTTTGGSGATASTGAPAAPEAPMTTNAFPANRIAQLLAATWSQANVMLKLTPVQDGQGDDSHHSGHNIPAGFVGQNANAVNITTTNAA